MARQHYILDYMDDKVPSLVGPFASSEELSAYARRPEFNPQDDLRWHEVALDQESDLIEWDYGDTTLALPVRVRAPQA